MKPVIVQRGDWHARLIKDLRGQARPILANAMLAIREGWPGVLQHDVFALRTVAAKSTPWGFTGPWTELQDALATQWAHQQGVYVPRLVMGEAVEAVAHEAEVHPVREFLNGVEWDRVPRIDTWLTDYVGTERTTYTNAVGAKWLIQAVARIMRPGCQADSVLIFEGPQGRGKSSAFGILGGSFFTDDISDLGSKDAAMQVTAAWLIELAELDAMSRPELSKVKAFLTRRVDRFRPPYGRRVVENLRQAVFCGSVNSSTYLRDETGARRFWGVKCGAIDLVALARDKNQIWAEALARFNAGESWWLDTESLVSEAEVEQVDRHDADPWESIIAAWVELPEEKCDRHGHPIAKFSSTPEVIYLEDVLSHAIGKRLEDWEQGDKNRVGRCLRKLGFELVQRRVGDRKDGRRERFYVRKK